MVYHCLRVAKSIVSASKMTSCRPSAGTWKFRIFSIWLVLSGLCHSTTEVTLTVLTSMSDFVAGLISPEVWLELLKKRIFLLKLTQTFFFYPHKWVKIRNAFPISIVVDCGHIKFCKALRYTVLGLEKKTRSSKTFQIILLNKVSALSLIIKFKFSTK